MRFMNVRPLPCMRSLWAMSTVAPSFLALSVVAAAASALALQGWKSRLPYFDLVTTVHAAAALVETGEVPDRGVISSFWSFTPPGAAWLMAPGFLVFDDLRLFESIGSLGTFIGTLWGIFLLARRYLGSVGALISVVLYAFSQFGLVAASSLWQRYPIHCFTVWTVYCVVRWVETDNHRMLAMAIVILAAGLYVFLEMAPVAVVIPIVWLLWRPVWRPASAAAALIAAFLMWLPYLQFQHERDFVDLSSLIERVPIYRADFRDAWCDATIAPASWFDDFERPEAADSARTGEAATVAFTWFGERAGAIASLLLANFRSASSVPGAGLPLFLLTLVGLLAFSVDAALVKSAGQRQVSPRHLIYVAICAGVGALLCNELLLARFLSADGDLDIASVRRIRGSQAMLLIVAVALVLFRRPLARRIKQLVLRWADTAHRPAPSVLAVCIAVPWALLLFLSEVETRFQWIWPLQTIALSASVTYVFRRLGTPRWLPVLATVTVVVLILANPLLRSRVQAWVNDGWSGRDAIEIQVVDAIAKDLGDADAVIGYEIEFWRFSAMYNVLDARYKAGAKFDLLLKYRHGITNRDGCAEGFSAADNYRVVQTSSRDPDPEGQHRLAIERTGGFVQVGQAGVYKVLARRSVPEKSRPRVSSQ